MVDVEAPKEDIIIELDNVHKTYLLGVEGVPAIRGVSLKVKRGEFIVILGTSGGGKTSMLNIIGTIDKPTKGHVEVCGTRISHKTADSALADIRLHKLGFVFQTFNLLSSMTAFENVELPIVLGGRMGPNRRRQRVEGLLSRVGMQDRLEHLPPMLSGGEQQRVTIARSVANAPELLLLDEPTGDLDTRNSDIVMNLLVELNEIEGITMVMVTHDVALKSFAHRVIHMRDGKISRIEEISEDRRKQQQSELRESIAAWSGINPSRDGLRDSIRGDMLARAGARPSDNDMNRTRVEVRKPGDYKIIKFCNQLRSDSQTRHNHGQGEGEHNQINSKSMDAGLLAPSRTPSPPSTSSAGSKGKGTPYSPHHQKQQPQNGDDSKPIPLRLGRGPSSDDLPQPNRGAWGEETLAKSSNSVNLSPCVASSPDNTAEGSQNNTAEGSARSDADNAVPISYSEYFEMIANRETGDEELVRAQSSNVLTNITGPAAAAVDDNYNEKGTEPIPNPHSPREGPSGTASTSPRNSLGPLSGRAKAVLPPLKGMPAQAPSDELPDRRNLVSPSSLDIMLEK